MFRVRQCVNIEKLSDGLKNGAGVFRDLLSGKELLLFDPELLI